MAQQGLATRIQGVTCEVRPGSVLGPTASNDRYEVGEELGSGAASRVFACRRYRGGDELAVKVVNLQRLQLLGDLESHMARLDREVTILRQLEHPRIVNLCDVHRTENSYFLVMEYVRGGELFNQIVLNKHLSELEARHVFRQLLEGVGYMHSKNVIHRDLKPENILIVSSCPSDPDPCNSHALHEVKIADFGLSKVISDNASQAKTCVGTPQYWAPEVLDSQRSGGTYDQAADFWGLGAVLFVMLSGRYPFDGKKMPLDEQIRAAAFSVNTAKWRGISEAAKNLVRGLLRVNPCERLSLGDCLRHPWVLGVDMCSRQPRLVLPGVEVAPPIDQANGGQGGCLAPVAEAGVPSEGDGDQSRLASPSISGVASPAISGAVAASRQSSEHGVGQSAPLGEHASFQLLPTDVAEPHRLPSQDCQRQPSRERSGVTNHPPDTLTAPQQPANASSHSTLKLGTRRFFFWSCLGVLAIILLAAKLQHAATAAVPGSQAAPLRNPKAHPAQASQDGVLASSGGAGATGQEDALLPSSGDAGATGREVALPPPRILPNASSSSGSSGSNSMTSATAGSGRSGSDPPVPSIHQVNMVGADSVCSEHESIFRLSELLKLQVSIAASLEMACLAFRHADIDLYNATKQTFWQARDLFQQAADVVSKYGTVAQRVRTSVLPDLSLAVDEQEPKLAVDLLGVVKTWVSDMKGDGDLMRGRYAKLQETVAQLAIQAQRTKLDADVRLSEAVRSVELQGGGEAQPLQSPPTSDGSTRHEPVNALARTDPSSLHRHQKETPHLTEEVQLNYALEPLRLAQSSKEVAQSQYALERLKAPGACAQKAQSVSKTNVDTVSRGSEAALPGSGTVSVPYALNSLTRELFEQLVRLPLDSSSPSSMGSSGPSGGTNEEAQKRNVLDLLFMAPGITALKLPTLDAHNISLDVHALSSSEEDLALQPSAAAAAASRSQEGGLAVLGSSSELGSNDGARSASGAKATHRRTFARSKANTAARSSASLLRALRELRKVDTILQGCFAFWSNMDGTVQQLAQMKELTERLVGFAHSSARLRERFDQRVDEYAKFWAALERLCRKYVVDHHATSTRMQEFIREVSDVADLVDTAESARSGAVAARREKQSLQSFVVGGQQ